MEIKACVCGRMCNRKRLHEWITEYLMNLNSLLTAILNNLKMFAVDKQLFGVSTFDVVWRFEVFC